MTNTTNSTLTDVHDVVVVHRAFRREFTAVPGLVRAADAGDTGRAAVVAKHARLLLDALHLHWCVLAVLLPVLLAVSVLVYPSSFVPALQTPLGWLENDGYVALLAVALYLTVQRLRRTPIRV